ncbi:preprotein translocase subunit SecE [Corynebacterium sp. TAE3-ERU12]|uniref:preprotein translocase subunit SecE n=1 Tax=Corynebacterium sp. TAE3-ERU12 TaxID=2849491 RepID=UPI001C44B0BB|nr:preprotein translocase subunit SecE [Corynebacterium sp. TAE3-ERU12]
MAEHNSTTSARPSGKRQVEGTASTRAARPARRQEGSVEGSGGNPITFLSQVISELRKVIWPTTKQMIVYTVVVLLFLAFTLLLVWGVDTLASLGVSSVFGS